MKSTLSFAAALLLTASPALAQATAHSSGQSSAQAGAQAGGKAKAQSGGTSSGTWTTSSTGTPSGTWTTSSGSGDKLTVVSADPLGDGDDAKANVVEVRVDNGKITVKRNGKEVPQSQIKRNDDGTIVILDDDGKPINNVHLFAGKGGEGELFSGQGFNVFNKGDGENGSFWTAVGDEGEAPKVMLGVHMTEPGPALEKHLHLDAGKCVMITGVFEGLPAFEAGVGEFDIIVKIDDSDAADAGSIRKILGDKKPGDTISLRVIQAGKAKDLKLKLQAYDAKKLGSAKLIGKEPEQMAFSGMQPLNGMSIDLKGLQDLPELKNRVFVTPKDFGEWRQKWDVIAPQLQGIEPKIAQLTPEIQKAIQDAMKKYEGAIKLHAGAAGMGGGEAANADDGDGKAGNGEVEAQLDQLDKRMSKLEGLLQRLIEKQQKP